MAARVRSTLSLALSAASGTGLVAACAAIGRQPNLVDTPGLFLGLFVLAIGCYGLGAILLWNRRGRADLLVVLSVAVGARLVLLPAPPTLSTDAYRYVWDARVAAAGISVYRYPASAPELASLRDDEIFPRLNHPTWRTIYPPLAQGFFRLIYAIAPDSVLAMKLGLALVESLAVLVLLGVVRALDLPLGRLALYAWHPLVLVEIWGSAHVDALVLLALVAALWASARQARGAAAVLIGLGTLVKLYPAALLPAIVGRRPLRPLAAFAATVAVGYASLLPLGVEGLGSLPRYLGEEYFNPGLARSLLNWLPLTFAATIITLAWVATRPVSPSRRALWLAGAVTVLSPNIFPWYALWLVPLLVVAPSAPWAAFTGTVVLAYTFFLHEPWHIPAWARLLEFAPLALGALRWVHRNVATDRSPMLPSGPAGGRATEERWT